MDPSGPEIDGQLKTRLETVKARIREAALAGGRDPEAVRLVAVSKTVSALRIREAIDAGALILGENYIQEAKEKIEALKDLQAAWHFIGHLQSNKAKFAARLFDMIHTVDSLKLAEELNRHAEKAGRVLEVLIQVNLSQEETKSGVAEDETPALAKGIQILGHLLLKGLMTMPPFFDQPERARPFFASLRKLRDRIREQLKSDAFSELSMGMTGDFEVAIEEGATLVRIGTAIFGKRR